MVAGSVVKRSCVRDVLFPRTDDETHDAPEQTIEEETVSAQTNPKTKREQKRKTTYWFIVTSKKGLS